MRRIGVIVALAPVLLACEKPGTTEVAIDQQRALAAIPSMGLTAPEPPKPPPNRTSGAVVSPGLPAKEMFAQGRDAERVRELVREQQRQTRLQLERQLRRFYAREARRFELEQLGALSDREQSLLIQASEEIRAEFERYATARMPLLARLTVLAGFPDPNPESKPPERPMGNVTQGRFDEAKSIRERMRQLDDDFDAFAAMMIDRIGGETALDRADTLVKIELFRSELNERAEREAREQVAAAVRELNLELTEAQRLVLPAVPDQRFELGTRGPVAPAPSVEIDPRLDSPAARRERLQGRLRIWLGLNRYTLKPGARDATEEFIQWLRTEPAGL